LVIIQKYEKKIKTIISLGLITLSLASCGNSGKQANSSEGTKQEAAPKMGSIYNESLTSSVKQYWESFLIPYLNQNL
jgi:hypothetical protein